MLYPLVLLVSKYHLLQVISESMICIPKTLSYAAIHVALLVLISIEKLARSICLWCCSQYHYWSYLNTLTKNLASVLMAGEGCYQCLE